MPGSANALWALADRGGPRPEYLLPVLYYESGFNPSVPNQAGYPYYGLNQIAGSWLAARGIDVNDYLTWSASRQLSEVVTPYMLDQIAYGGSLNSGARTYQAEFLPATLRTAKTLSSVLTRAGESAYNANAGFDWDHKGYITVADMAHAVSLMAAKPAVQQAIAQTYALRPGETSRDPVLGTDFGGGTFTVADGLLIGGGALAVTLFALAMQHGYLPHPRRAFA